MGHEIETSQRQAQVDERVEVRIERSEAGVAPTMFLWQGRLYAVRAVLRRWSTDDAVWRVEAAPGRALGASTFDLTRRPAPPGEESWTLQQVAS